MRSRHRRAGAPMHSDLPEGLLPNLFIVGAPKCGTTSLYEYLRQHPQIYFPWNAQDYSRVKEPNHFCPELAIDGRDAIPDRDQYLDLYRRGRNATWRGDASTNYLYSTEAAARIHQSSPDARILISLRPPVAWMRSYHGELLRHRHEDIADFHAAVAASAERRHGRRIPPHSSVPKCLDYLAMSQFAAQVERYYRTFGRQAVKVILLEDLAREPERIYAEVLEFLGVDPSFHPAFVVHNATPKPAVPGPGARRPLGMDALIRQVLHRPEPARRSGGTAPMDCRDRALQDLCRADVDRLAALIGRDLSHWQPRDT